MKQNIFLWLKIIRPQTLFASFCPVMVGLLVARKSMGYVGQAGHFVAFLTLFSAVSLQILSNLVNDYYDFHRGADKQGRAGFKRALAEGWVTEQQMLHACYVAATAAILSGIVLVFVGGWTIALIGLSALLFAWLYTATNHSLSYLGIADIFVFLYYGVIAVCGTVWLQWQALGIGVSQQTFVNQFSMPFCSGAVCGLISMLVLAINNIRDMKTDKMVGKRTIPVRFGKTTALVLFGLLVLLMPLFAWLAFSLNWAMLIVIPAAYLFYRVIKSNNQEYNMCLMEAGVLNLVYVNLVWLSL